MCGKNLRLMPTLISTTGSPPRVREEQKIKRKTSGPRRITPACAGRTLLKTSAAPQPRDHPRVCGKNHLSSLLQRNFKGSPPRVREELDIQSHVCYNDRITPACAGRTVKKSPFYAFSFSRRFINPFTFVASSLKISTFVLLRCSVLSPIPYALHTFFKL